MHAPASVILFAVLLSACSDPGPPADGEYRQDDEARIVDDTYVSAPLWDDGRAEVAFYELRRSRNQYGEAEEQEFLVGTYLVKHDYDPEAEAKATSDAGRRVQTFKYALFYELESGSYEYKRSYVTNARRADLRPMKTSFTSFDWCSNQYRELTFDPDGTTRFLMRSDDYGNERSQFEHKPRSFPPAQIPLLIRGLDFTNSDRVDFGVQLESGEVIGAAAQLLSRDSISTAAGSFESDRIDVHYESTVPSPLAEEADSVETYWRATDESRTLLRLEGSSGRYEMELVERLRSPYWEEDVYDRLERVSTRP